MSAVRSDRLLNVSMKWLTREWATGQLDDHDYEERWRAQQSHRVAILPRLSHGAEKLVKDVNLHDAQIHSFEYRPGELLVVRALIGDLQVGYEFIELSYIDAELGLEAGTTIDSLRLFDTETEILYDEVDVDDSGRFLHNVLLWPRGDYEVSFTALREHRQSASPHDRR